MELDDSSYACCSARKYDWCNCFVRACMVLASVATVAEGARGLAFGTIPGMSTGGKNVTGCGKRTGNCVKIKERINIMLANS
jgi:hypothetical protein